MSSFFDNNISSPAPWDFAQPGIVAPLVSREPLAKIVVTVFVTYLLWRTWRFTISPLLHPETPRELPYLIPFIGHARAFFSDSNGLLERARKHFENADEPFAITALGTTSYVVLHPKQSAEVYKNTETLSFEDYVQTLMRANGNSEAIIKLMYTALPFDKLGFPNPLGESLGNLAQKMHIHQLQPGQNLNDLQDKANTWITRTLSFAGLFDKSSQTQASSNGAPSLEVPLYKWCSDYFVRLGQYTYFGDLLDEVDPLLPEKYFIFDERIWKMLYQYPNLLSGSMSTARAEVISALRKLFEIPADRRRAECAWLINAWEDETKAIGVDDDNLAIMVFFLYFAINTNTRKTSFWLLAYLIHNPELMEAFRRETAPAFSGDDLVDPTYFLDPEKCPQVDHIWNEVLRVVGWSCSVRLITQDTVIGGKLMRKGNRVMVPHRLLHFDERVFGEDPQAFRPERWDDPALAKSPCWKPFGAGKTLCSGRFLARSSVTTFVATLVRRFDIENVGSPRFPEADKGKPVLGIISLKEGQDFKVRLTPRETGSL